MLCFADAAPFPLPRVILIMAISNAFDLGAEAGKGICAFLISFFLILRGNPGPGPAGRGRTPHPWAKPRPGVFALLVTPNFPGASDTDCRP